MLETQPDEERRHRVEVRDSDTDMVEASYVRHGGASSSARLVGYAASRTSWCPVGAYPRLTSGPSSWRVRLESPFELIGTS